MDKKIAAALIQSFAYNQTAITHAVNRGSRGVPKTLTIQERKIASQLFEALTGFKPVEEDFKAMLIE